MTASTLHIAVELATRIEQIAPQFGAHVALTGGCLYKSGPRKDIDLLFYRIRQVEQIDEFGLLDALCSGVPGLQRISEHGWCTRMQYCGHRVDFLFPERNNQGGYPGLQEVEVSS